MLYALKFLLTNACPNCSSLYLTYLNIYFFLQESKFAGDCAKELNEMIEEVSGGGFISGCCISSVKILGGITR